MAPLTRRGPKFGDSRSLWNHSTSPGWNHEELRLLKLCLMKYGIGQWTKILSTGLLPGKVTQQLNCQTQRLLGQQSLAGFTGLVVDLDQVRADNDAKVAATRKSGLVIHTGAPPTKRMKQEWKEENQRKYALSEEKLKKVSEELGEIQKRKDEEAGKRASGTMPHLSRWLFDVDARTLDRDGCLDLLIKLRQGLVELVNFYDGLTNSTIVAKQSESQEKESTKEDGNHCSLKCSKAPNDGPSRESMSADSDSSMEDNSGPNVLGSTQLQSSGNCVVSQSPKKKPKASPIKEEYPCATENREVHTVVRIDETPQDKGSNKPSGSSLRSKRKRKGCVAQDGRECKRQFAAENRVKDVDNDGFQAHTRVAFEADVQTIMSMGYSRKHAKDALLESRLNMEGAVEWLLSHCT